MDGQLLLSSVIVMAPVVGLPAIFHLTRYLGAKSDNPRKNEVYESGIRKTVKDPFDSFDVRFFLVGVIFLFDVEVLHLFPWAVDLRELGLFGAAEMFVFMKLRMDLTARRLAEENHLGDAVITTRLEAVIDWRRHRNRPHPLPLRRRESPGDRQRSGRFPALFLHRLQYLTGQTMKRGFRQ
ncbi:NADH-quinone oxidoreductase subunit A [Nitratifractor sp.]